MLSCNPCSVLKMIIRSETSTNQSGSAMNRSGLAAQSGSEINRSGSLRTYLIMEYGEQTQRLEKHYADHMVTVLPFSYLLRKPSTIWSETSKSKNSETGMLGTRKKIETRGMLSCNPGSVLKTESFSKIEIRSKVQIWHVVKKSVATVTLPCQMCTEYHILHHVKANNLRGSP